MPPPAPPPRKTWPRWLLAVAVALLVVYALVGFLLVPWWLERELPQLVERHLGWEADFTGISTNPFTLGLSIDQAEARDGGETVARFDHADLSLSWLAFFQGRIQVDELALRQPFLRLELDADSRLSLIEDWRQHSPLAGRTTDDEGTALLLDEASLEGGRLLFLDHRRDAVREFSLSPLNLTLTDIATYRRPGESGHYQLEATLGENQRLRWQGTLEIFPFQSKGELTLENLQASTFWHFLGPYLEYDWRGGVINLSTGYRIATGSGLEFSLEGGRMDVRDGRLFLDREADEPALTAAEVDVSGVRFEWPQPRLEISDITAGGWNLRLIRNEAGTVNWTAALRSGADEPAADQDDDDFTWHIQHLGLREGTLRWQDAAVPAPVDISLDNLAADFVGLTGTPDQPVAVTLNLEDDENGQGQLHGEFTVIPFTLEAGVQIAQVALAPLQPYLTGSLAMEIVAGQAAYDGQVSLDDQKPELTGSLDGNLVLEGVRTRYRGLDAPFVEWQSVRMVPLQVSLEPFTIDIRTLTAQGPELTYIRLQDGLNSFAGLTADPDSDALPEDADGDGPTLRIRQIDIKNATLAIEDREIEPDFRTRIHQIDGSIFGLSNLKPQRADINLRGQVAEQGSLHLRGQLGALGQDAPSDLRLEGENLNLVPLSPYFGRYLGYTVARGELEIAMDYTIAGDSLDGENHIVMRHFELGEKVDSPVAVDVPVPMGIALLRGPDGVIEIDLPVSGDLGDPRFSFSNLILGTFTGLVVSAATSPFTILANIAEFAGLGEDELSQVAFIPGTDRLAPDQRDKLQALGDAIRERGNIALEYRGATAPAWDGPALVLAEAGFTLPEAPLWQQARALEEQVREREGDDRLEALLQDYQGDWDQRLNDPEWTQMLLRALAGERKPEDGALRTLAEQRAAKLHQILVEGGGIDPDRLVAQDTRNNAQTDDGQVLIPFTIETR